MFIFSPKNTGLKEIRGSHSGKDVALGIDDCVLLDHL